MLAVLLEQDHRQQAWAGPTAGDHMEGCRSLADLLAVAAGEFLADMLDHLPYVDGPLPARRFAVFNQIACVHMSGLT
jgi:hypothetical protein